MRALDMPPYPFSLFQSFGSTRRVVADDVGDVGSRVRGCFGRVVGIVGFGARRVVTVVSGVGKLFCPPCAPTCKRHAGLFIWQCAGQVAERPPQPVPSRAIIPRRLDVWLAGQPGAGLRAWCGSKVDVHFFSFV